MGTSDTAYGAVRLLLRQEQLSTVQTIRRTEPRAKAPGTLIAVSHTDEIASHNNDPAIKNFFLNLLSPREFAAWTRLRHPMRSREWLTVRLLAKHVIVSLAAASLRSVGRSEVRRSYIRFVNRQELLPDDTRLFRLLELLPVHNGEKPRLWFEHQPSSLISCSVSHSNGWVAVAFSEGDHYLGVDIERVRMYSDDFRAGCFSDREQAAIKVNSAATGMSAEQMCAIFWTLKESAYKAGEGLSGSLLRTEVAVRALPENGLSRLARTGISLILKGFDLDIFTIGRWRSAQAASCQIGDDHVLSVVSTKKGENSDHANPGSKCHAGH